MCTLIIFSSTYTKMKKNLLIWITTALTLAMSVLFIPATTFADDDELDVEWFEIMPKLDEEETTAVNTAIQEIWSSWWHVREIYNATANSTGFTTKEQLASWIMNRDTIMNYIVFVIKFLSQLWLLVWAWFIMFAWYKYMLSVFGWWKTASSTLKNAIIWVIIVIFSYAIMKILTSIIWLT